MLFGLCVLFFLRSFRPYTYSHTYLAPRPLCIVLYCFMSLLTFGQFSRTIFYLFFVVHFCWIFRIFLPRCGFSSNSCAHGKIQLNRQCIVRKCHRLLCVEKLLFQLRLLQEHSTENLCGETTTTTTAMRTKSAITFILLPKTDVFIWELEAGELFARIISIFDIL